MIWYVPFVIQAIVMFVDEFIMHEQRGLPKWERIGHPLDSLTVMLPYLYVFIVPYSENALVIFAALSLFSCVFITKDEFVHAKECNPLEHWLHAMLFVLHPLTFFSAGHIWMKALNPTFLMIQPIAVGVFMLYQILRWSFPWPTKQK